MTTFIITLVAIIVSLLFVWIKTILEIANTEFTDTTYKIVWILFVFFMPVVGICCWYIFGKSAAWEAAI